MKKVNEKLNDKMIKRIINPEQLSETEFIDFKKHIKKFHVWIDDMYFWSVYRGKYEVSDFIIDFGYDVNLMIPEFIAGRICQGDIESLKRYLHDGLRVNKKLLDRIKKILSEPENYYEEEDLQFLQNIYDNKQLILKLNKLKKNIKLSA